MELSSPLAAMKPPPVPFGCRRQAASRTFGPSGFNFRDLSMKKSQPDYFSIRSVPVRGSSPTASLAADLSQNFHIDQSPQLPTPRRSLFTGGIFGLSIDREGATTPPIRWEGCTTPPVPSSSPGFGSDPMDLSPLPHKAPYSIAREVKEQVTVAVETIDEDMISPCDTTPLPLTDKTNTFIAERKKSFLVRPPFCRTKCFSSTTTTTTTTTTSTTTTTAAQRTMSCENQLSAFRFGAGGNGVSNGVSASALDSCFKASPPQNRVVFGPPLAGPSRQRHLSITTSQVRSHGSPNHAHTKKPVPSLQRPRKQFRRSLSMFEHPGDVIKQHTKDYSSSDLQSIMDVDDTHELKLPHFIPTDEPGSLPRINHDTLIGVLNGDYDHFYDQTMLVDCRFEYEYNGGHIDGAENFNDKEELTQQLFQPPPSSNILLIFHCEFSKQRAPLMAQHIRKADRAFNACRYPKLTYPEIYILDGGYSSFYKIHRTRCYPQSYVEMDSVENELACERGMHKVKQRAKLSRAQTYAFGQRQMQDSPSRASGADLFSPDISVGRLPARRMASY